MKIFRQFCDIDSNVCLFLRYLEVVYFLYEIIIFDFSWNLWFISNFCKVILVCYFVCIFYVNIVMVGIGEILIKWVDKDNNNGQIFQWFLIWEILVVMDNFQWLRFEVMFFVYDVYVWWWMVNLECVLWLVKMVIKLVYFEFILFFDVGDWV